MDNGRWTEIMYLSGLISIADPADLTDRSGKQQPKPQIRVPFHPSKQQPYKIFVLFRVFLLLRG